MIYRNLKYFG